MKYISIKNKMRELKEEQLLRIESVKISQIRRFSNKYSMVTNSRYLERE